MKVAMPQLTVDWYGAMFPDQKKPKNKQTETEKTQGLDAFCGAKKSQARIFKILEQSCDWTWPEKDSLHNLFADVCLKVVK